MKKQTLKTWTVLVTVGLVLCSFADAVSLWKPDSPKYSCTYHGWKYDYVQLSEYSYYFVYTEAKPGSTTYVCNITLLSGTSFSNPFELPVGSVLVCSSLGNI